MDDDRSLTPQEVADLLKITKNTVYELIKRGELASYKVGRKIRVDAAAVEALKRGKETHKTPEAPLPGNSPRPRSSGPGSFVICGQDSILDILARYMELEGIRTYRSHQGSYNGLYSLYNREVQVATCHLWDGDSNLYNIPFVRRMLPGTPVRIVHIVKRMQGFYVAPGNPLGIHSWEDLLREDVSLINRERGSGTRVLLDEKLMAMGASGARVKGYDREVTSHLAAASAVCRGKADVAIGTEKGALQVRDVEFVPVQKERYEMVIPLDDLELFPFSTILKILNSPDFRDEIDGLGGYDTTEMGKAIL